ncbi:MAG: acyl-CoA oxidase [Acidobacteria bacterium]|nr:acyl-CoA oxidase [Acidobacteriota bacterium]
MPDVMPLQPPLPADAAALPFLPALYVAWADGDLTAQELDALREKIQAAPGLTPDSRAALEQWLQPDAPPSAQALQTLLEKIRTAAPKLAPGQRASLADLGLDLSTAPASPETQAALEAIEDALGVVGSEAARELLDEAAEEAPPAAEGPWVRTAELEEFLDGELRPLRRQIRELLQQPLFGFEYGLSKEQQRERVLSQLLELGAQGLGALSYPTEYGGEADSGKFAAAFETLAYGDISLVIKYGVQFGLFGGAIRMLGTARHHDRHLRRAGTVELPGCFAMTELGHGSNVADIETTAVYDAATGEIVVNTPADSAHKEYIGNAAAHGRLAVVFAQLEVGGQGYGVHAVLVPIRNDDGSTAAGVRIEDCGEKEGLNGVDNGRLWFDHVRVPRENLLNRFGDISPEGEYVSPIASPSKRFFTMIGALVAGRVSIALAAVTVMKTGLTIAVRYGAQRRQFGPAGSAEIRILDYRTHQRRLMPRVAEAYALHFAVRRLAERFALGLEEESREVEALAAGLKAYATWANLDALQECRECCGGQGYMAVNRLPSLKADTDIFCTFEGDNTVLMQLLVKALLSDYKRQFEDMRPFTLLKYLGGRAAAAVGEPSPLAARTTDSEHLRSASFQLEALRRREARLLDSVARRLRHRIQRGMDSFQAFNDCQDHVLSTGRASVERYALERFQEAVEGMEPGANREELDRLRALYGLHAIERDAAWFLEAGMITGSKSRAIRAEVNALCREVRLQAEQLVTAWGVPEGLLPPIAKQA